MEQEQFKKPKLVAEIGCNHKGEISIANRMIDILSNFCDVDIIKFQKRTPKELLTPEQYYALHPVPENSYGKTYGEHREYLELDLQDHYTLKNRIENNNKTYSTSVWDLTSAKEIVSLNPFMIKIPSAVNTNEEVMKYLYKNYSGDIHISLGMTYEKEENNIIELAVDYEREKDIVLYACTSSYPTEFNDIYLYEITRLKNKFGNLVKGVGFSGHHLGIAVDIAAMALGVDYIERHFTLDRTWKGTDHAASLEPDGMRKLVRDLDNVYKTLQYKYNTLSEKEIVQRKKLKQ